MGPALWRQETAWYVAAALLLLVGETSTEERKATAAAGGCRLREVKMVPALLSSSRQHCDDVANRTSLTVRQCAGSCVEGGGVSRREETSCLPRSTRMRHFRVEVELEVEEEVDSPKDRRSKSPLLGRRDSPRRKKAAAASERARWKDRPPSPPPPSTETISVELLEHLDCVCAPPVRNAAALEQKSTTATSSSSSSPASVHSPSTAEKDDDADGSWDPHSSLSSPPSPASKESADYYQTCLACKLQAEACEESRELEA